MARKKTGLGKGLDAILPESLAEELELAEKTFAEIPLDNITPNPLQPRLEFNEESLAELAESIKAQGVLQPIIVVPNPEGGFMLIAGERRWRAAKLAGLSEIPAIILKRELSKEELLFVSLVENLQREDLDPVEEAQAYKALMEKFNLTQDEIAKRVGKSRPAIANALRILKLPEQILKLLKERKITAGHARVLLEEKDPMRQIRLAKLAASRGLSVERLSIIVIVSYLIEDPFKPVLPFALFEKLDLRANKPYVRRKNPEVGQRIKLKDSFSCRNEAKQYFVDGGLVLGYFKTEPGGGVALRVEVHEQNPFFSCGD